VTSSVAVEDGQTIGLAGVITDTGNKTTAGLPILSDIPVLGLAFGARGRTNRRTELIVLITPRVIRGRDDGEAVTRELREKLRLTVPVAARR
jgi:general secretion pathway protein D